MRKRSRIAALGMGIGMALTSGCGGHSGAAFLLGTATTVLGGVIVADTKPWSPDEEGMNSMVGTAGGAVMLGGMVLMIAGMAGVANEARPLEANEPGLVVTPPAPRASSAGEVRASENPNGARAEKIAVHIRLAARANRCPAAMFMMKQLGERDRELVEALRTGDEHVAHCAARAALETTTSGQVAPVAPAPAANP